MDTIHARFRAARELAGLTQGQVARHFGVDRGTVYRWDTGYTKLSIEVLAQAAVLFGCDRNWLVFGDGDAPVAEPVAAPKPSRRRESARRAAS
jgi:transcriptional regulator with XRE-family HTH domain